MKGLFEYLKSQDLITRRGVNAERIAQLSPTKILDYARELIHATDLKTEKYPPSAFSHCASISLAGGRQECQFVGCRAQRLEHLARFAVFYSDRVYIRNFFSDYFHFRQITSHDLRRFLTEDIYLVTLIRPLLESGLLRFISETGELCPDCLGQAMGLGQNMAKKFLKACHKLEEDFFYNTSVSLDTRHGPWVVELSGPELYYPHGNQLRVFEEVPKSVSSSPMLMKSLERNGRISLSKILSRKLRFHKELASEVVHNIAYHLFLNSSLQTSFLTDKDIHLNFLKYATDDKSVEERNLIASRHLTTIVPFVGDVAIKDLLRLRDREGDSFVQFRSRLNAIIDEFRNRKTDFTTRTARAIHGDIIAPELARLEKKINVGKRDLVSSLSRSFFGMVGAISFGLFSGVMPAEVVHIAQAVGGASFGADMIKKIMALGDAKKSIESEDLYFLWKVKQIAKKA